MPQPNIYSGGANRTIVNVDQLTRVTLPDMAPEGYEFIVNDNLGLGKTVTIAAPVAGATTTTVTGQTGWAKRFLFTGAIYTITG